MTSQKHPNQKTQDDSYSNHDKEHHQGPSKSSDSQPGPKIEKSVPEKPDAEKKVSMNIEPEEEKQVGSSGILPEKDVQ